MSDRDRLIKLLEQGRGSDTMPCQEDDDYDCTGMTCEICENRRCADLILADGWIKPPCKVGDILKEFATVLQNRCKKQYGIVYLTDIEIELNKFLKECEGK